MEKVTNLMRYIVIAILLLLVCSGLYYVFAAEEDNMENYREVNALIVSSTLYQQSITQRSNVLSTGIPQQIDTKHWTLTLVFHVPDSNQPIRVKSIIANAHTNALFKRFFKKPDLETLKAFQRRYPAGTARKILINNQDNKIALITPSST